MKKRYHAIVGLAAMLTVMLIPIIPLNAASDSSSKELTEITHVEMGGSYALALDKQGVVWAWGANFNGQLGDGTTGFKSAAVPVFSDVNKIQATSGYSLVLKKDGTVWFWGGNGNRVSGLDNFETKENVSISSPTKVSNLSNVIDIAAKEDHNLALKADGTVWSWGNSQFGQLGRMDINAYKPEEFRKRISEENIPKQVTGLKDIVSVHAGSFLSAAINTKGETWIWGHYNGWGDQSTDLMTPVKLEGILANKVTGNWKNTIVMDKEGTIWEVKKGLILKKLLTSGTDISCGNFACAALSSDGTVRGLIGGSEETLNPVPIAGISNVKQFAIQSLNQDQLIIVKADGTLWTKVPFGYLAGNESLVDYYNQMNVPYNEMGEKLRQVKKAITVQLDGKTISLTTNPYIYKGVTFVPLRSTFNELGAKVEYVQGKMTISNANHILKLTIRQNEASIDGRAVTLDFPPMIVDTMTMVPLRFVIEALDNKIDWDPDNRLISISSPNE
ncbi:stalk domain-containing protein [Bacillus sp. FJAT-28004]|uniref:stalk domain-containing protein n=1 Tax=Bacillus sp. FJAT-28004 TaxID=1679165 RepID=UPI0006B646B5|nr:stalk domain-containing protein [Bacillus sp. FJAT-28004]